jgi:hypothetical protein
MCPRCNINHACIYQRLNLEGLRVYTKKVRNTYVVTFFFLLKKMAVSLFSFFPGNKLY